MSFSQLLGAVGLFFFSGRAKMTLTGFYKKRVTCVLCLLVAIEFELFSLNLF